MISKILYPDHLRPNIYIMNNLQSYSYIVIENSSGVILNFSITTLANVISTFSVKYDEIFIFPVGSYKQLNLLSYNKQNVKIYGFTIEIFNDVDESSTEYVRKTRETSGLIHVADTPAYSVSDGTDTALASEIITAISLVNELGNAAFNLIKYKGSINCSANPNYPAADAGHVYLISAPGKIGGSASGLEVEEGDMIICHTDETAAGSQAAVGSRWGILQKNITGYVLGPTPSIDNDIVTFNGITGKLIKDSGFKTSDFARSTLPVCANGEYSGTSIDGVAGATLAFGNLVYLSDTDSRWELTDANLEAKTKNLIAICVLAADTDGSTTKLLLHGRVRSDSFPSLTVGAPVFISSDAGAISSTAPSTSGKFVRIIGYAVGAKEIIFNPASDWIELL